MSYNSELQANNEELQSILNTVNALPNADSGGDIDLGVTGATVGQTVKIAEVDDNGVPTAWESVDFPSGGGSGGMMELYATIPVTEAVSAVVIDLPETWEELFVTTDKNNTANDRTGAKVSADAQIDIVFDNDVFRGAGIGTSSRQRIDLHVERYAHGLICEVGWGANNGGSFTARTNGHVFMTMDRLGTSSPKQLKFAITTADVTFLASFSFYVYAR